MNNQLFLTPQKPAKWLSLSRFLLLAIVLLSSSFTTTKHAFHTSLTEMRYNAKTKTLEISMRVFTDDLERTLSHNNANRKFVVENNDKNDAFIEAYIRKHFGIVNAKNQRKTFQYVGKEKEVDATWIYLEMPLTESIDGAKIQNDVLMDMYEDQTNIINLFIQQDKKSFLFTINNKIFTVDL
jgi:hypothetical protein